MSPLTSFKLSQLADILEVELDGNPDTEIFGLSSLDLASERDISFSADSDEISYMGRLMKRYRVFYILLS